MSRARDVADFIPAGGAAGTSLVKASGDDYDTTWSAAVGNIPEIIPTADRGKALVIDETDAPEWGAPINSDAQVIDAGSF